MTRYIGTIACALLLATAGLSVGTDKTRQPSHRGAVKKNQHSQPPALTIATGLQTGLTVPSTTSLIQIALMEIPVMAANRD